MFMPKTICRNHLHFSFLFLSILCLTPLQKLTNLVNILTWKSSLPHSKLHKVKALVVAGKVRATYSAVFDAAKMGLSFHDMVDVVLGLTTRDFYKSMTTYADHKIWQDVYRPNTSVGEIYLKLTVIEDVLIVSFKEL